MTTRTWVDGPAGGTPINAARLNGMEADMASAKGRVFNVMDYGAVGNNSTDDTAAFQATMNALGTAGGGVFFIPAAPVAYNIPGTVTLVSNVEIHGKGAIIRKNVGSPNYCVFVGLSGASLGYGGGVKRVSMHGVTFRGDLTNSVSINAMSLHRAQGIHVWDCKFLETTQNGHVFDLQGCEDVVIESSEFRGIKVITGREYVECIQLDISVAVGSGFPSALAAGETWDGTSTRNVRVSNCTFGPITVGGVTYPSPCPLGSHEYLENAYFENIIFSNNTVTNVTPAGASYYGMLHFTGAQNVKILNNVFDASGVAQSGIRFYRGANAVAVADISNPSATTITPAVMAVPNMVDVVGNTFLNFNSTTATPTGLVEVYGSSGTNLAYDVKVINNTMHTGLSGASSGPIGIVANYISRLNITGNAISTPATLPTGISLAGGTAQANVSNNVIIGYTTPIATSGGATATTANNVTA